MELKKVGDNEPPELSAGFSVNLPIVNNKTSNYVKEGFKSETELMTSEGGFFNVSQKFDYNSGLIGYRAKLSVGAVGFSPVLINGEFGASDSNTVVGVGFRADLRSTTEVYMFSESGLSGDGVTKKFLTETGFRVNTQSLVATIGLALFTSAMSSAWTSMLSVAKEILSKVPWTEVGAVLASFGIFNHSGIKDAQAMEC